VGTKLVGSRSVGAGGSGGGRSGRATSPPVLPVPPVPPPGGVGPVPCGGWLEQAARAAIAKTVDRMRGTLHPARDSGHLTDWYFSLDRICQWVYQPPHAARPAPPPAPPRPR